jgi:hypothetical protein
VISARGDREGIKLAKSKKPQGVRVTVVSISRLVRNIG